MRPFRQVDVFSAEPLLGNPVAVVHDADGLTDEQMASFARWTNLSETTFLLTPTTSDADYRLRIWTIGGELPFAGHPTLGSAHAWLEAGGVPRTDEMVVQECGAGLVSVRRGKRLAFAAPPLLRSGAVTDADLDRALDALGLAHDDVVEAAWIDNGPGWMGLLLRDVVTVLAIRPEPSELPLDIGVVAPLPPGGDADVEVRAFFTAAGITSEDPVTGSLNAGLAQWLAGRVLPMSYIASQGTVLRRRGRVHVTAEGGEVWVGGDTLTTIVGTVGLGD